MFPVLMAGGSARRFGTQKLFIEICGFPLFYWPLMSLKAVFERVYVAYTKNTASVANYRDAFGFIPVMTRGTSYSYDVGELLESVGSPILTLAADSVFINPVHIELLISRFSGRSTSAVTMVNGTIAYTGLNIAVKGSPSDELVYLKDLGEPLSINTYADLRMVRERIWTNGCSLLSRSRLTRF